MKTPQKPKFHAPSGMPPPATPSPGKATAEAASGSVGTAEPDDRSAASIRAQQLRAGKRRAANERVMRLEAPTRPGWHRCWVNDTPGNVQRFAERGYDFVIDSVTKERFSRVVGVQEGAAGGLQGFLMEIPEEIYDEDCKALEERLARIDGQINRGAIEKEPKDNELHVPTNPDGTSRIKIETLR